MPGEFVVGQRIEGSSLHIAVASPDDPRIDEFYFGDEVWEAEIATEFKSRIWEEKRDMFLFALDDETLVAGARMGFRNIAHPHRDSTEGRAKYFLLLSFGVNAPFQGELDGVDRSRSYAKVICPASRFLGHPVRHTLRTLSGPRRRHGPQAVSHP